MQEVSYHCGRKRCKRKRLSTNSPKSAANSRDAPSITWRVKSRVRLLLRAGRTINNPDISGSHPLTRLCLSNLFFKKTGLALTTPADIVRSPLRRETDSRPPHCPSPANSYRKPHLNRVEPPGYEWEADGQRSGAPTQLGIHLALRAPSLRRADFHFLSGQAVAPLICPPPLRL